MLWALNFILLLLTARQFKLFVHARRRRRTGDGREFLQSAIRELRSGSSTEIAKTALEGCVVETRRFGVEPQTARTPEVAILLLARATGEWVDAVRASATPRINEINMFCELIEEGLLRPVDLVRESPSLHGRLVEELTLLEPFIWYQAILGGRGRWGFRALQLLEALGRLRAVSPNAKLRDEYAVQVADLVVRTWPAVSPLRRRLELIRSLFRPHALSVRSKVLQNRQRDQIETNLRVLAPDLHFPPKIEHKTLEW